MTLLPTITKDLPFVLHEHKIGSNKEFQLSIQTSDDELEFINFKSNGKISNLSNTPNIGRYFGNFSEDTRVLDWLSYEGFTKNSEGTENIDGIDVPVQGKYSILDQGTIRVGEQKDHFSEIFFKGTNLTDRWMLRKIPNVFDKSFLGDDKEALLFWKPPRQKTYDQAFSKNTYYQETQCACAVADASAKFHDIAKVDGNELISKMQGEITFNSDNQTFEGIAAAEGTWVDMYGNKYTYTPEFITHIFNKEKDAVSKNEGTFLSTSHDYTLKPTENISGQITGVHLGQDPIKHIIVNGNYDGPADLQPGKVGLSYEFKLRSSWNEDFQSYIPFDATLYRLSVVRRPACKICWINKVK